MEEFREQSGQWFDRIDIDLNDTITRSEIRKEFECLFPPGLRWKNVGFNKYIFNVSEMSYDSYIRVNQTYFKQDVDVKQIHEHADIFSEEFDTDQNCTLDADEFEVSLILSLENTIPGFNVAQVVTLWSIFKEEDDRDSVMVRIFVVF
jgi:hypothetical protein